MQQKETKAKNVGEHFNAPTNETGGAGSDLIAPTNESNTNEIQSTIVSPNDIKQQTKQESSS